LREGATYLVMNDIQRHPRVSRMHTLFTIDGAHVYVQAFLIRKVALVIRWPNVAPACSICNYLYVAPASMMYDV
jgi:hypothetical protein